ncbi:hypothetical protein ABN083_07175 [Providencia rettgeri]
MSCSHIYPLAVTEPSLIIGLRSRGCLRVSGADLSFFNSTIICAITSNELTFRDSSLRCSMRFSFLRNL